jgi:uncharacterized membrane protein
MQGSAWISDLNDLKSTFESIDPYGAEVDFEGFRVAMFVPEPSTGVMATIACGLLCLLRKRFERPLLSLVLVGAFLCTLHTAPLAASAVTIDWVHVGDPGNAPDFSTGFSRGAVDYEYRIGKYDVTNDQYVEFLNSNDPTGANKLELFIPTKVVATNNIRFDSEALDGEKYSVVAGGNKLPVTWVTQFSAMRFANWLQNGQVAGSTESGAYTLLGGEAHPSNWSSIVRSPSALFFLPTVNEWFKAGYYNPVTDSYYKFPTSSNSLPAATLPSGASNSMNIGNVVGMLTDVGAYSGTTSPYGAFDMGGNARQWLQASTPGNALYGGSDFNTPNWDDFFFPQGTIPTYGNSNLGFRVAAVIPEPCTGVMAAIACGLLCLLRKRFKKT